MILMDPNHKISKLRRGIGTTRSDKLNCGTVYKYLHVIFKPSYDKKDYHILLLLVPNDD